MKTLNFTTFLQGYANAGNANTYAIKTPVFRGIATDKVSVFFEGASGKNVQMALVGYSDPTPKNIVFEKKWYTDNPHVFDLSLYPTGMYWVVVFTNQDGTEISPSDMATATVVIENVWHIDTNGELRCDNMPYAPEKSMYSPFPATLWRSSGDAPTHTAYPTVPEKPMKKPYPASLYRIDYLSPNMPYHKLMPNIKAINMWALPRENVIRVYDYKEPQEGFKHNGVAILAPSECTEYHELNGRWDIELTHPVDDWGRWKNLLPQNVLKIDGQLFRIDELTSVSGSSGMYIKVHAKHISYDLADEFVHYYWGENLNGYEFIRAMFGACLTDVDHYDKYIFQYSSDIQDRTGQFEITDKSLLNTLIGDDNCLISQLGGELYRDNFYFSINKRMESARDNAFALKYGFDMTGITQKIDYSDLATWLMVDNNYGESWAVSYVDNVYPVHHHKHTFRRFSYSDSADSYNRLVRDGQELFGQLCRPKVSYEVNIASLKSNSKYSGFLDLQNYNLGDRGTIECEMLGIKTVQEIISVEIDRLTGDIKKIKLGNEVSSLIRPSYKSNTISTGSTPAEKALQKQVEELGFREYITTPITTNDRLYLMTKDNEYLLYKE